METKTTVSFVNVFMAKIETEILSKAVSKPTVWKRYIDDVFSLWNVSKLEIETFIKEANLHHLGSNSRQKYVTLRLYSRIQRHEIQGSINP